LAAILPAGGGEGTELRQLPVDLIRPNPKQPRRRIAQESIDALADSVRAAGVVQPVIVRPMAGGTYELIAGERRWRAAQAASLDTVPAVVRDSEDAQQLELALIENMAREDLNPIDAAQACAGLVEDLGISKEEVGRRLGRSRSSVSNLIRLLELPAAVLALLQEAKLSEGHGRAILQVEGNDARRKLAEAAVANGWSVRETERRAGEGRRGDSRDRRPAAVAIHPDQESRRAQLEDQLETALGRELRVRLERAGAVAELRFDSLDELADFAERFGVDKAA
jgi:ParB family transcriptional regulator, chromosome partitioning protein